MLSTVDWLHKFSSVLDDDRFADMDVYLAPAALLDGIVGFKLHQRIMALGRIPDNAPRETFMHSAGTTAVFVALQGMADAENMGMILRNCAAFGVHGVLVGSDSCSPWLRRSVRVSVGTLFKLRIRQCDDVQQELRILRDSYDLRIIAVSPRKGGLLSPHRGPLCLLFGGEARGLADSALEMCDGVFSIPMHNEVDSINVANAVAVALYATTSVLRQNKF